MRLRVRVLLLLLVLVLRCSYSVLCFVSYRCKVATDREARFNRFRASRQLALSISMNVGERDDPRNAKKMPQVMHCVKFITVASVQMTERVRVASDLGAWIWIRFAGIIPILFPFRRCNLATQFAASSDSTHERSAAQRAQRAAITQRSTARNTPSHAARIPPCHRVD